MSQKDLPDPSPASKENLNDGASVIFIENCPESLQLNNRKPDDVNQKHDHQVLDFDHCRVEITVNKGKVSHSVSEWNPSKKSHRSSRKRAEAVA